MSQHDYNIANGSGLAVRGDLNDVLLSIASLNSGATEPTTKFAFMLWADTANDLLKVRNAANSAWVTVGTLSAANLGLLAKSGGTLTGALQIAVGTVAACGMSFSGDANTGIYSSSADIMGLVAAGTEYLRVSSAGVDLLGTGAVKVPVGSTAQQPGSPATGMVRYNSTTGKFEGYYSSTWGDLATNAPAVASKTANYTTTDADEVVYLDGSGGAFNLTLHTPTKNQRIVLKRTDNTLANVVSLVGTVDGATDWKFHTISETYHLQYNTTLSTWRIVSHYANTDWVSATALTVTGESSNPTKGTVGIDTFKWRRQGSAIQFLYKFYQSANAGAAAGSGNYIFALPSGLTVNTTVLPATGAAVDADMCNTTQIESAFGDAFAANNGGSRGKGMLVLRSSTTFSAVVAAEFSVSMTPIGGGHFQFSSSTVTYFFQGELPISGWKE